MYFSTCTIICLQDTLVRQRLPSQLSYSWLRLPLTIVHQLLLQILTTCSHAKRLSLSLSHRPTALQVLWPQTASCPGEALEVYHEKLLPSYNYISILIVIGHLLCVDLDPIQWSSELWIMVQQMRS